MGSAHFLIERPTPTWSVLGVPLESRTTLVCNAVMFSLQAFFVYAGNAGLFGGKSNAAMARDYPSLVTPASYAFSIWGLIYIWEALLVFLPLLTTPTYGFMVAMSAGSSLTHNIIHFLFTVAHTVCLRRHNEPRPPFPPIVIKII